jgi:hypothetical protein
MFVDKRNIKPQLVFTGGGGGGNARKPQRYFVVEILFHSTKNPSRLLEKSVAFRAA